MKITNVIESTQLEQTTIFFTLDGVNLAFLTEDLEIWAGELDECNEALSDELGEIWMHYDTETTHYEFNEFTITDTLGKWLVRPNSEMTS